MDQADDVSKAIVEGIRADLIELDHKPDVIERLIELWLPFAQRDKRWDPIDAPQAARRILANFIEDSLQMEPDTGAESSDEELVGRAYDEIQQALNDRDSGVARHAPVHARAFVVHRKFVIEHKGNGHPAARVRASLELSLPDVKYPYRGYSLALWDVIGTLETTRGSACHTYLHETGESIRSRLATRGGRAHVEKK